MAIIRGYNIIVNEKRVKRYVHAYNMYNVIVYAKHKPTVMRRRHCWNNKKLVVYVIYNIVCIYTFTTVKITFQFNEIHKVYDTYNSHWRARLHEYK